MAERVQFVVEEPSMEEALRAVLPKLLPADVGFDVLAHSSKGDLLKKLPNRLLGYAAWLPESWRVVVLIDRDDDDCKVLKQSLEELSRDSNLYTKSNPFMGKYSVINRIVVEELESWYFGDWDAVQQAYPRVSGNIPRKAQYRNPDNIRGGTWESFERILKNAGYFTTGLRKMEAANAICQHMDPSRNTSSSFQSLRVVLRDLNT